MKFYKIETSDKDFYQTIEQLYDLGLITDHYYHNNDSWYVRTNDYNKVIVYITMLSETGTKQREVSKKEMYANKQIRITKGY